MNNIDIKKIAEKLAEKFNHKAEKFDLYYRDYDDKVELIGFVPDPTVDMKDFIGREILFPKRWITLEVLESDMEIA